MSAIRLPEGFAIGHWSDPVARTGCTVVIAAHGATAGVDVRGAAPTTLGTDTLRPGNLVDQVHAVLLTGGSAFGLDAVAGVLRHLEERGVGFELAGFRVPIVAGAVLFDLAVGDGTRRPDAAAGYAACAAAGSETDSGSIGAGTGATVAKGGPMSAARPGGLGVATASVGPATVTAVMVTNAVGGIRDDERGAWVVPPAVTEAELAFDRPGANTTLGLVLTDARLTREQANRLATVAHDGIARAIRPAHTMYDGDAIFVLAGGRRDAGYDALEMWATRLVSRAIADGVRRAQSDQ